MLSEPAQTAGQQQAESEFEQQLRTINEELLLSAVRQHELIEKLEIAEKKLSFLGLVVASSAESIVTVDFDGIVTTWNMSAERVYGYAAAEAVGKPITMLTLPEDLKQVLANIDKIRRGEGVGIFETVRIQKGGAEIDLEILMSPVTDADGRVIGVATIARDITERVKAAAEREAFRIAELDRKSSELKALRESEMQLAESQMRLAIELSAAQQLQAVSTQLIGEDDPNALYESILDASQQITRAQFASIQLLYPERGEGGELFLLGHRGFSPEAAKFWEWVKPGSESACGRAMRTGERVIVSNIEADETLVGSADLGVYLQSDIFAVQTTPLVSRSGQMVGMMSTHWNRPHIPTERDLRLLDVLARQAADGIERLGSEELLRRQWRTFNTSVSAITDFVYAFDREGRFIYANKPLLDLWGRTLDEAVGKNFFDLDYPRNLAVKLQAQIREVFDTRKQAIGETAYISPAGAEGYYEYIFNPVFAEDGTVQAVAGSTRDITERKKAEKSIRFQAHLLNTVEQAAIATDLDGNVTYWNRFAEQLYGWTADEAMGRQILELTTPEIMAEQAAEIMSQLSRGKSWSGDFNVKRRDGTVFPAHVINSPIQTDAGDLAGIIGISVDITDRKRVQEELHRSHESLERRVEERTQELAAVNIALQAENVERRKIEEERVSILQRLVTAQEDVRRRIGRDLHDRLGQQVTALRLKLEAIAEIAGDHTEIKEQIRHAQEYARKVDVDAEFLTFELRPTALDDLGLVAAIEIFVREWSRKHEIAAEFQARTFEETLPSETEINVYRIVQEALHNTLKHARAKSVAVQLNVQNGNLVLIVEDDGIGFDQGNIAPTKGAGDGLGLIGMRERCLLVGGNLEIESTPGKGTAIFARIPLTRPRSA